MHLSNLLSAAMATLLAASLPAVHACEPQGNSSASEQFTMGSDGPADAATIGYNINHVGLNVNDLDAAMHFYGKVLGMRHIFTYQVSPILELVYLGFSVGGKNGTGFQTSEELYKQEDNTAGLLELLHRKDCNDSVPAEPLPASTRVPNTLCHIGLVVPDIAATEKRMQEFDVPILKRTGVDPQTKGPMANAFGVGDVSEAEGEEIVVGLEAIGFKFALIVEDPDGNVVEIMQQK